MRLRLVSMVATLTLLLNMHATLPKSSALMDRSSSSQVALKICPTKDSMDCIESLQYRYGTGKWIDVMLLRAPSGDFQDEHGQRIENSGSVWSYRMKDGSPQEFVITATLNGENYQSPVYKRLYPAMWFSFLDLPLASVASGLTFRFTLRASWLKPQGVGLMAANADFQSISVPGGRRYIFIGSPFLSTSLDSPEKFSQLNGPIQDQTKSDRDFASMYFVVDHHSSIPGGTFWDPLCADFGYSVTSHNAIGAGQPYMSDDETLRFNIGAPHRLSNGEINRGFFSTDIHVAYLDCRWPTNKITKSPRIEVSIINQDGTSQVATTSVLIDKGILKVRATGFHYSSPTITLRASNNLALPTLNQTAVTKAEVTCKKGKQIKALNESSRKCPKGWKRV